MPMTIAQWANSVALIEFEEVMRDEAQNKTWDWSSIYGDKKSTDDYQFKGYIWTGFGYPHERKYTQDIQTEKMQEIGSWTLTDVEFSLGSDIDDKLLEDLRHITEAEFLNQMGERFGESFAQAESLYAAMPFNRAFSNAIQVMWDTKALCDTHNLLNGKTYVNKMSAGSPSFSRIWDMVDKLRLDQRTQKNLKKRGEPWKYVCYESHAREIEKIFGQEYEPDGLVATGDAAGSTTYVSSKNKNTLLNKKIGLVYCRELIDTDAHFLLGKKCRKNFHFRTRKPLTTKWLEGPRNRSRSVFNHQRVNVGVTDWEDVIGTPGT